MVNWIEYTEAEWRELNMEDLDVDQAYINAKSSYSQDIWLYILSEECYTCPYERKGKIKSNDDKILEVDIAYPLSIEIFNNNIGKYAFKNETPLCNLTSLSLGEFGVYNLTVSENGSCSFEIDKEPVNTYFPFLFVCFLLLLFSIVIKGLYYIYKKYNSNRRIEEQNETEEENKVKKRLRSLDTFRGITIALMIFVNSGGGHYWWIEHATWNGLHIADIVFPSFLWIMGVCIPISIQSQLNRGVSKLNILKNIFFRSVKLFLIGVCLNSVNGPNLEYLRIMGVLQRFGIAYFISASLHTIFHQNHLERIPHTKFQKLFHDVLLMKFEWLYAIFSVVIYIVLTFGIKYSNCPRGYLGPGGKHNMAQYPECTGGINGFIDRKILTENHIYQHSTSKHVYDSVSFDPEGIFGCILTVVQVIIGVQCGVILKVIGDLKSRMNKWIIWSLLFGIIGGILCLFSKENGWIPINKNLWSLSFICVTSCIAIMSFTIFYFIIDIKPIWSGSPFMESGMNSIVMYVGHSVLHKMLPWHWRFGLMNTHFMLLLECTWNTVIWIGIAVYLYKKKIFYNL